MKKRLLAILVSALMLTNLFAITGLAFTLADGALTLTGLDTWQVDYDGTGNETMPAVTDVEASNFNIGGGNGAGVFKFSMPVIDAGKVFDKAWIHVTSTYETRGACVYALPGDNWDMSTITSEEIKQYVNHTNIKSNADANAIGSGTSVNYEFTVEITEYMTECIDRNQTSLWLAIERHNTEKIYTNIAEKGTKTFVSYTVKDAPAFALDSSTPVNGAEEIAPPENVTFTFNNTIKSATAKVNGADAAATSDGKVVTVDYDFAENTEYTVSVSVTDTYGSSLTEEITFTTGRDVTEFNYNREASTYYKNSDQSTGNNKTYTLDISKPSAVFFTMTLPSLETGKVLSSYKVSFTTREPITASMAKTATYIIPRSYNSESALHCKSDGTSNDVYNVIYDDSYKAVITEIGMTSDASYYYRTFEVELTGVARERIAYGDSVIRLAITCGNKNIRVYGVTDDTAIVARSYGIIENNPSIVVYDKSAPVVSGSNLASFGFGVYTDPTQLVDDVVIRKAGSSDEITGKFVYNKFTNKIELSASVALDEDTDYAVVIKQGAADGLGNTLADDLQLAEFSTGKNIIIAQPKLVASTSEDAYADCIHLEAVAANDSIKAVSSMQNLSDDDLTVKFIVAQYNGDELIAVTPAEVTLKAGSEAATVATGSVTISANADGVKAFVWYADNRPIAMPAIASAN